MPRRRRGPKGGGGGRKQGGGGGGGGGRRGGGGRGRGGGGGLTRPLKSSGAPPAAAAAPIQWQPPAELPPRPAGPPSSEAGRIYDDLSAFIGSKETTLSFPPTASGATRRTIHELSEAFGLAHDSVPSGSGKKSVRVEKRVSSGSGGKDHWEFRGGYIGLFGPAVNAQGKKDLSDVPKGLWENRVARDRTEDQHITILLRRDLAKAFESVKRRHSKDGPSCNPVLRRLLSEASGGGGKKADLAAFFINAVGELVTDDWRRVGLGRVKKAGNEAYFQVVDWESGNRFLEMIGMEKKDFHITVGFRDGDIHGVCKGRSTLI